MLNLHSFVRIKSRRIREAFISVDLSINLSNWLAIKIPSTIEWARLWLILFSFFLFIYPCMFLLHFALSLPNFYFSFHSVLVKIFVIIFLRFVSLQFHTRFLLLFVFIFDGFSDIIFLVIHFRVYFDKNALILRWRNLMLIDL